MNKPSPKVCKHVTVELSPRGAFLIDEETGDAFGISLKIAESVGRWIQEMTQKVIEDIRPSAGHPPLNQATNGEIERMFREIATRNRDKRLGLGATRAPKPPYIDGGWLCSRVKGE